MYVVTDISTGEYLKPRPPWYNRKYHPDPTNGNRDGVKWTGDLQDARVFRTKSAASNALKGGRKTQIIRAYLTLA